MDYLLFIIYCLLLMIIYKILFITKEKFKEHQITTANIVNASLNELQKESENNNEVKKSEVKSNSAYLPSYEDIYKSMMKKIGDGCPSYSNVVNQIDNKQELTYDCKQINSLQNIDNQCKNDTCNAIPYCNYNTSGTNKGECISKCHSIKDKLNCNNKYYCQFNDKESKCENNKLYNSGMSVNDQLDNRCNMINDMCNTTQNKFKSNSECVENLCKMNNNCEISNKKCKPKLIKAYDETTKQDKTNNNEQSSTNQNIIINKDIKVGLSDNNIDSLSNKIVDKLSDKAFSKLKDETKQFLSDIDLDLNLDTKTIKEMVQNIRANDPAEKNYSNVLDNEPLSEFNNKDKDKTKNSNVKVSNIKPVYQVVGQTDPNFYNNNNNIFSDIVNKNESDKTKSQHNIKGVGNIFSPNIVINQ